MVDLRFKVESNDNKRRLCCSSFSVSPAVCLSECLRPYVCRVWLRFL